MLALQNQYLPKDRLNWSDGMMVGQLYVIFSRYAIVVVPLPMFTVYFCFLIDHKGSWFFFPMGTHSLNHRGWSRDSDTLTGWTGGSSLSQALSLSQAWSLPKCLSRVAEVTSKIFWHLFEELKGPSRNIGYFQLDIPTIGHDIFSQNFGITDLFESSEWCYLPGWMLQYEWVSSNIEIVNWFCTCYEPQLKCLPCLASNVCDYSCEQYQTKWTLVMSELNVKAGDGCCMKLKCLRMIMLILHSCPHSDWIVRVFLEFRILSSSDLVTY